MRVVTTQRRGVVSQCACALFCLWRLASRITSKWSFPLKQVSDAAPGGRSREGDPGREEQRGRNREGDPEVRDTV